MERGRKFGDVLSLNDTFYELGYDLLGRNILYTELVIFQPFRMEFLSYLGAQND
jgi:hypothetical protein